VQFLITSDIEFTGYRSKTDKLNKLWNDVLARPLDWIDNRPDKKNGSVSVLLNAYSWKFIAFK
jgi:hypothetical protein